MSKTLLYGATKVDDSNSAYAAVASLEQFQWKSRVMVVFADADNEKGSRQENLLLAEKASMVDRDLVVLRVQDEAVSALFGAGENLDGQALRDDLDEQDKGSFVAILIGKDGSVKLRAVEPLPAAELFAAIDAMPMRAAETTRQHEQKE